MSRMKEKFCITIRVRPNLVEDSKIYKESEMQEILEIVNQNAIKIERKNYDEKTFRFNRVFFHESQEQIYEKTSHLVNSIFQGHNATFLAYGQTGTGKTHTIFGSKSLNNPENGKGYFHRSVNHIFSNIRERMQSRQFAVRVSFVEFYLDNIYDLIQSGNKKLQIKQTLDDGIHIRDAVEVPVKSEEELLSSVREAILNRKTEETSINKRSSRSHAIIQLQVLQRWNEDGETKYLKGTLKIVDLAGSERVSKTQSFGARLEEAKRINKEITTLGKCISMLAQSQKQGNRDITSKFNFSKPHIPYRDCKITRFLTDTLEGRSKIVLCVCISKYSIHLEQSYSSLMFAMQASTLKIESKRNEVYTLKKSVQKSSKRVYQTPIKAKLDIKISEESQKDSKDENLVNKFLSQIEDIQSYLQGKSISKTPKKQTQLHLSSFEKIMRAMRQKLDQERGKPSSQIHYN